MYIGIAQIIQIIVCIAAFVTIIKWIQSQRYCKYCTIDYMTEDGKVYGCAFNCISSYASCCIYIAYSDKTYYLDIFTDEGCETFIIKRCPVCGRKLR